jgi:hypothetical protein
MGSDGKAVYARRASSSGAMMAIAGAFAAIAAAPAAIAATIG